MLAYFIALGLACATLVLFVIYIITYKRVYILDDNITYRVLELRPNKHYALKLLYDLNHKTLSLIKYIKNKYNDRLINHRAKHESNLAGDFAKTLYGEIQHAAKSVSDVTEISKVTIPMLPKIEDVPEIDDCTECVSLILQNYNPDLLVENDPIFTIGDKTYTLNFKRIAICLRRKNWEFYDFNTLMFVFLHEIAHTGTHSRYLMVDGRRENHPPMFWRVFKFLLSNAVEFGIIAPINYNQKNYVTYCGIDIQNNPLFDRSVEPLI